MNAEPSPFDRAAEWRDEPEVLDRLRRDAFTRVIVIRDRKARVENGRLVRVPAADVAESEWALLGRDEDGSPLLLAVEPDVETPIDEAWLGIRDAGGMLDRFDMDVFIESVALAGWLDGFGFCPACGTRLELRQGGWSRHCDNCGAEHFPRTDPAVIVAVESADGERLLLGANASWQGRMYSCFAGFVEAGESLESTVHRELYEEAGIRVDSLRYLSSQPWPYPRSLMLGFRAVVADEEARADGEEIIDVRWLTRPEVASSLRGEGPVGMPGPASIARALIVDWYEERS